MSPPSPQLPSRILMTTDAVGGVWTYATGLAAALCECGHKVTLVTIGPAPSRGQVERIAGIERLSIEVTDLALEWMDPEAHDLPRANDMLLRIADRIVPDIVHLNSFREATIAFNRPVLVVAHSCVGSWWQACRPQQSIDRRWQTYLRNVADGLNAADKWAAPTVAYREWIEAFYQPQTRGEAIWNGAERPRRMGRKQNEILAAGRVWDEAKNLQILGHVADAIEWPIHVAGPMRGADGSAAAIDGVHHLGELPHAEVLARMQQASIFVAPSLYEPFGLGILEAAGCGCALVLSDIPSLRELWRGAALFVPPHDAAALRDALQALCRDDDLRGRLAISARNRARRYSLDAMSRDYQRLYRDLTQTRPDQKATGSLRELRP